MEMNLFKNISEKAKRIIIALASWIGGTLFFITATLAMLSDNDIYFNIFMGLIFTILGLCGIGVVGTGIYFTIKWIKNGV
jgi:hypothetical protein